GQCLPALHLMQNPVSTPVRNLPIQNPTENLTPAQNPIPTSEGNLILFDENSPTLHLRVSSVPAVNPGIGSSLANKTILIHKNITNGFEFYDEKRKWYGVKEDFYALSNKYYFIKTDLKETTIETYERIIKESKTIAEKTNDQVDIETTLALKKSEKVDEKENAWLNLATTGAL
ncbi:11352_t:CDS:2, partial [Diversispora eburnea]